MTSKARDFYYLGRYLEASQEKASPKNAVYVLAAHSFRGEHLKCRHLYDKFQASFSTKELVLADFHLALSFTRTSEYSKAQELFVSNWKRRHDHKVSALERFYIFQGLSFFRFFFSQHSKSLAFSFRAYKELLSIEDTPKLPLALVCDLLGHNYYQLGLAAKGKQYLKEALKYASENSFYQLKTEFEASLVIYESQFDPNLKRSISSLKKLLRNTSEENDYTRSELVLQVAKLYYLKGAYKKANDFLVQNFNTIYKNDNKRKVAKLNTLLAQLLVAKGQLIEALSLCKVARENLDEKVDINLLAPVLGTEEKVFNLLGQEPHETRDRLRGILSKTDKGILRQIQKREQGEQPLRNEQDQLGIIFDEVALKEVSGLEKIIKYDILHLAKYFFGPLLKPKVIIPHPQSRGIFLIDETEVLYQQERLSQNLYSFFVILEEGAQSKEALIKRIWGYQDYDPLRHDHLIYTLVRRARRYLGDKSDWIQTGEDSYQLGRDVQFFLGKLKQERPKAREVLVEQLPEDLNFRQVQVLEGVFSDGLKASEVGEYFKVTRMTAYRDLNELVEKGLLKKRGKGRGTTYLL